MIYIAPVSKANLGLHGNSSEVAAPFAIWPAVTTVQSEQHFNNRTTLQIDEQQKWTNHQKSKKSFIASLHSE